MISEEEWRAYDAALTRAQRQWHDGDPPPPVTAVAEVLGLDPERLDMHVEGIHGWEWHNEGYPDRVWDAARCRDPHCFLLLGSA